MNDTLLQPFSAYALGSGRMLFLGMEATYGWSNEQWTAPVTAALSQVVAVGGQRMSIQIGGRYFADAPQWGLRTSLTLIFPRRPNQR